MASPPPAQGTLQGDTLAWAAIRDAYLNAKAAAYSALLSQGVAVPALGGEIKAFDAKKSNQQDGAFKEELNVDALFGKAADEHNKYDGTAGYSADEAWPKASGLVDSIVADMTAHAGMNVIKPKLLQLNALEAYRKTTLARRQFRQQILTHMQARCANRPAEMVEIVKLLTDQRTRIGDPFVSSRGQK